MTTIIVVRVLSDWLAMHHEVLEILRSAIRESPEAKVQGPTSVQSALDIMQQLYISLPDSIHAPLLQDLPRDDLLEALQDCSETLQAMLSKVC